MGEMFVLMHNIMFHLFQYNIWTIAIYILDALEFGQGQTLPCEDLQSNKVFLYELLKVMVHLYLLNLTRK